MCEKQLALLFRLYPSAFRERYLHEALLLYRDRCCYETGIYRRLRLAYDLFADFFTGLPMAWRASYSVAPAASPAASAESVPSFRLLQAEPLRPGSILLGSLVSISTIVLFVLVLRAAVLHPIERHGRSAIDRVLQRLNQPEPPPPAQDGNLQGVAGDASASAMTRQMAMTAKAGRVAEAPADAAVPQTQSPAVPDNNVHRVPGTAFASPGFGQTAEQGTGQTAASERAGLAAQVQGNAALPQGQAKPEDATQAMLQAISTHQVVMFGETHGNKQEYEWLCKLVKTPAFADHVDDIVVEFGNSLYQKIVDRYIAGEDVPQAQVEKAWRNTIGAVGPVSPVYGWFYRAVRESNLARRDGHKIRLLLGDPYGDWDKIRNANDLGPYIGHRDAWYAEVVKDEVLAKHHHALLIAGAGHFARRNGPGFVERAIRAAGVQPYLVVFGTNAVASYDDLDHRFDAWPLPAIVSLSSNWVGGLPANPVLTGGEVAPNAQKMRDVADAMLYAGSRDTLREVVVPRSELVNTAYGKEVERRVQIQTSHTMDFTEASESPQYGKPLQQIVSNGVHGLPPNPPGSANDPLPPRPQFQ